jgi:hypothetical protein
MAPLCREKIQLSQSFNLPVPQKFDVSSNEKVSELEKLTYQCLLLAGSPNSGH